MMELSEVFSGIKPLTRVEKNGTYKWEHIQQIKLKTVQLGNISVYFHTV
jgi:hypothetical protein